MPSSHRHQHGNYTFKPLGNDWFRCNQVPEAGKIKGKNIDSFVRRMEGAKKQTAPKIKGSAKLKIASILSANIFDTDEAICPCCHRWNQNVHANKNNSCRYCTEIFYAE